MVATKGKRNSRRRPMKKRMVRRKKVSRKPYTKISKQPVAERYFTRLRYSEIVNFTLNVPSALFTYQFQSSVYDPDYTSTGHQPLWRDTLATMYNKYRVFGVKYSIHAKNASGSELTQCYVKHNSSSATETNFNTLRETAEGKGRVFDSSTGRPVVLRGYMPVYKPYGISKKEFCENDDFISVMGANPNKMSYIQMYAHTVGGTITVTAQCDLIYYVEFFDRIDITGS